MGEDVDAEAGEDFKAGASPEGRKFLKMVTGKWRAIRPVSRARFTLLPIKEKRLHWG